jgi:succinoglycan biosynthesis transport protein ExoP
LGAQEGRPVSTLRDYLRILRRRKWVLLPAVIIAPAIAVLLSSRQPVVYEASAQVLIDRHSLPASLTDTSDPSQTDPTRLLTTQAQLARVPAIARTTLSEAGLRDRSASDLLGASRVSSGIDSDILTFTVEDPEAPIAVRLATEYGRQFIAYKGELDARTLEAARASVKEQIEKLHAAGDTHSPLYESLVEKADQLTTVEALSPSSAVLVRPATGAARLAPPVVRNGVLALLLGLMTSIGLAFLWDALDSRVRSAEEIGGHLSLRLLGRLPRPPRSLRKARRLAMLAAPDSPYAEPFRMLRSSLEFALARLQSSRRHSPAGERTLLYSSEQDASPLTGQGASRLMVTSAVEGEGKSTTVANLAVALALEGRHVVLLDLDFRRASLHRFFDLEPRPGLMEVLGGSVELSTAITYVDLGEELGAASRAPVNRGAAKPRLGVLPLGASPLHGGDLAVTLGLDRALEQIGNEADLVLIDGPPLLRVGDAMALTSYVHGLLVVASLSTVRPPILHELNRVLEDCPPVKLGFIVTGADVEGGYEYLTYPYYRSRDAG